MTGSIHEVRDESLRARAAWAVPLLPIALSGFLLSALTWLRLRGGPAPGDDGLAGFVVALHDLFGFEPLFMVAVLTLAWSSIRFLGGELDRPMGRAGRIAIHGLCLAILVNLRITGTLPTNAGEVGAWFAGRLVDVFGPVFSILVVSVASLASLVLATDFFFYRYFEELAQRSRRGESASGDERQARSGPAAVGAVPASAVPPEAVDLSAPDDDRGIEDEAVEALQALSFAGAAPAEEESRAPGDELFARAGRVGTSVIPAEESAESETAPVARGPIDLDEAYEARLAEGRGGRRLSWRERRAIRDVERSTDDDLDAPATEVVLRPGEGLEVYEVAGESAELAADDEAGSADEDEADEDWSEDEEADEAESTELAADDETGLADEDEADEDWSEDEEADEAESTELAADDESAWTDADAADEDWSEDEATDEAESTELAADDETGSADEEADEDWSEDEEADEAGSTELAADDETGSADEEEADEDWSEDEESDEADSTGLAHVDAEDDPEEVDDAAADGPVEVVLQPVPADPQGQQKSLFPIGPGDDELLAEARDLVVEYRRASRNFLRRRLRVSSDEAEDLLVELARRGVVSYRRGDSQGRVLVESA